MRKTQIRFHLRLRKLTAAQVLRLFSLAERHQLMQHGPTVQVFQPSLTELQRQVLELRAVPPTAYTSVAAQHP